LKKVIVDIIKLVNGGQGLGYYNGKPVFAWNVLPGETVAIRTTKSKKDYLEGVATHIFKPSAERIAPEDGHYLSCSPWQIMTVDCENRLKVEIAKETFKKLGDVAFADLAIISDQTVFGYRNKIKYRFTAGENGKIAFAFYERGSRSLVPLDECLLAKANINKVSKEILDWLNGEKFACRDLDNLTLRENSKGQVVASLFVKEKDFKPVSEPPISDIFTGFQIYLLNSSSILPKAPRLLHSFGDDFIVERIAGKNLKCGPLSFFQVNVDVFEKALSRIKSYIEDGAEIVDFYSGVGSIGIAVSGKVKSCVLVESDIDASRYASANIESNGLKNFESHSESSENMLLEIKKSKTIIFDPPRSGLHPKIIDRLLEVLPSKIIYLSCDIATIARDIKMLRQQYEVTFCELYNFFPRTPHIESLVILER
jgi:23S rRNA (uracil1939-C5)-methyltransferase